MVRSNVFPVLQSHYYEQAQTELKVVIVGDFGVGKTSFIKRHINGFLSKKFLKEHGCNVLPMMFSTNKSTFLLQVTPLTNHLLFHMWGLKVIFEVDSIFTADMGHPRPRSFRWIKTTLFVRQFDLTFCMTEMFADLMLKFFSLQRKCILCNTNV